MFWFWPNIWADRNVKTRLLDQCTMACLKPFGTVPFVRLLLIIGAIVERTSLKRLGRRRSLREPESFICFFPTKADQSSTMENPPGYISCFLLTTMHHVFISLVGTVIGCFWNGLSDKIFECLFIGMPLDKCVNLCEKILARIIFSIPPLYWFPPCAIRPSNFSLYILIKAEHPCSYFQNLIESTVPG